jgi:L-threonylcarbamoyladenylate synthase
MKDAEAIRQAAEIIQQGGIVAFPTETVYGLGANGYDPLAVARVFEVKRRPSFDPLILHVADPSDVEKLVKGIPSDAKKLIERFWPGPLTVVLLKKESVPDIVTAGLPTAAIRMPKHPMALSLIKKSKCPIAAPSANRANHVSPTAAAHVLKDLGGRLRLIVDGGPSQVGIESTVLDLTLEPPCVLRPGMIHEESLRAAGVHVASGRFGAHMKVSFESYFHRSRYTCSQSRSG